MSYPYNPQMYQSPYPAFSNPYSQIQQNNMQPMMQAQPGQASQMQNQNTQISQGEVQSGGFVTVRSEEEARSYPVAPGKSMTFFNETQPYCYKKTMSFSPLDHPVFERYKIVKEETSADPAPDLKDNTSDKIKEELKSELDILRTDLEDLKSKVKALSARNTKGAKKDESESE